MKVFYRISILFFITSLLLIGCREDSQPNQPEFQTINFSGQIVDQSDNPVPNAEIHLKEISGKNSTSSILATDTTDEEGNFTFEEVKTSASNVEVMVEHKMYASFKASITDFEENKDNTIALEGDEDCCGLVKLTIKDKDGNPIKGVEVKVRQNMKVLKKGYTHEHGTVEFDGLCLEEYEFRLAKEGYKVIEEMVKVESCEETKELNFTMNSVHSDDEDCCYGTLVVKPTDEEGNEINGAIIKVWQDGHIVADGKTEHGKVAIDSLCEGTYRIYILSEHHDNIEFEVEIECEEETLVEKTLKAHDEDCCKGALIFKPKDKKGETLNGVKVYLYKDGKLIEESVVENGKTVIDGLCEGKYTVVYKKEGYENKEFHVELGCNKEKVVEETMKANHEEDCCESALIIKVTDDEGNEIKDAYIKLWKNGKFKAEAHVEDGKAIIDGLCEGKYGVDIISEHHENIEFHVEIGCDEEKVIEKTLKTHDEDCCKGALIFKPKDENGETLNGVKVYLYKDGKIIEDPVVENGKAVIDGLCEGKYTIVYKKEGYENKEFHVELGCNKEKVVEETMHSKDDDCCEAILKFIVKDKESKVALHGATVTLKLDGKVIVENKETNADGIYIAKELCKGKYTVIIKKDGYKAIETYWNVEKCDDFQEHFWMEKL